MPAGDGRSGRVGGDLERTLRPASPHAPVATLVCVENTHNGAGGKVTSLAELRAIRARRATRIGIPVHMDGARLWNASVATGYVARATSAGVRDTVMLSFSKGLGCPVGAMLVGDAPVIDACAHGSQAPRRRACARAGILAAAALYALDAPSRPAGRRPRERARASPTQVDGAGGARVVAPDTNIVMVDLPDGMTSAAVVARGGGAGRARQPWSATRIRAVTHLDVDAAAGRRAAASFAGDVERAAS